MRTGALKGIAFLYFRAGDVEAALDHLQRAAEADPDDPAIPQAIARVRRDSRQAGRTAFAPAMDTLAPAADVQSAPAPAPEPDLPAVPVPEAPIAAAPDRPRTPSIDSPFAGIDEGERGLLLVDANGMCLGGALSRPDGTSAASESQRSSRDSVARPHAPPGCSAWGAGTRSRSSPRTRNLFVSSPTPETLLVAVREPALPMARVGLLAERAGRAARGWLERSR